MIATVKDGRITKLQGDPNHPITRGALCERTKNYVRRVEDPDRLTTPLIRTGTVNPKSPRSAFKEITWEEALELCASKLIQFRRESGPESIFHYQCGGSLGILKKLNGWFFDSFGPCTTKRGNICDGPGYAAQELDFGSSESNDLSDLENAETILLWGKNPNVSNVHLIPFLKQALKRNTKLISINPIRHATSRTCDLVIQPRPGTDPFLALALAGVLFEKGMVDSGAAKWCENLPEYRAMVECRTPSDWLKPTGVELSVVEKLAELYGSGPATILCGWGMQRRANGGACIRLLDSLAGISGNIGIPGAGVSFYCGRTSGFNLSFLKGVAAVPRTLSEPRLGAEIMAAHDPPVRMVWVTCANPVVMLPDSGKVAQALQSREFTVVSDSFLTDTAQCADLVLPTTTMLEEDDLIGSYGHYWISDVRKVVEPAKGARSDLEIFTQLAERTGIGAAFPYDEEGWKERIVRDLEPLGISPKRLRKESVRKPFAPKVVFEGRKFPTPTGKMNLIHKLPTSVPSPSPEFPLYLLSNSISSTQGSQASNGAQTGPTEARIHPETAAAIGKGQISDGESAVLESEWGNLKVEVIFDDRVHPEAVVVPKGGWHFRGRSANALIAARVTDLGEGACYLDETVRLRPAAR
jgi:anaerobic selenocysteine-containing dehydrogenase